MTAIVSSTCSKKPLEPTSFQSRDLGDIVQKFERQIWKEGYTPIRGMFPYLLLRAQQYLYTLSSKVLTSANCCIGAARHLVPVKKA